MTFKVEGCVQNTKLIVVSTILSGVLFARLRIVIQVIDILAVFYDVLLFQSRLGFFCVILTWIPLFTSAIICRHHRPFIHPLFQRVGERERVCTSLIGQPS